MISWSLKNETSTGMFSVELSLFPIPSCPELLKPNANNFPFSKCYFHKKLNQNYQIMVVTHLIIHQKMFDWFLKKPIFYKQFSFPIKIKFSILFIQTEILYVLKGKNRSFGRFLFIF